MSGYGRNPKANTGDDLLSDLHGTVLSAFWMLGEFIKKCVK